VPMTIALLAALSQLADGLAFQLANGHGIELNPGAATMNGAFGPMTILLMKVATAIVLGVGSYALLRRDRGRRLVLWLAVIGYVGAFSELLAVV
jgi:hypothetical protein